MPDMRCFISALKLRWIKGPTNSKHRRKTVARHINHKIDETQGYVPTNLLKYSKENAFWGDIFLALKYFVEKVKPESAQEVIAEPLFSIENIYTKSTSVKGKE